MPVSVESLTEALGRLPVIGLIVRAALKSRDDYAKDMSASIAFFSFFSLFPLLLGVIAGASLFLEEAVIQRRLTEVSTLTRELYDRWMARLQESVTTDN